MCSAAAGAGKLASLSDGSRHQASGVETLDRSRNYWSSRSSALYSSMLSGGPRAVLRRGRALGRAQASSTLKSYPRSRRSRPRSTAGRAKTESRRSVSEGHDARRDLVF